MDKRRAVGCAALLMCMVAAFQGFGQSGGAKPEAVPVATYSDPDGDVSFEYPAVWKLDNTAKFYLLPDILVGGVLPRAQVIFSSASNYYASLTNLVFAYVKKTKVTAAECETAALASTPAKVETVPINGVFFQHFDTGDAGMGHGSDQPVYWTYRELGRQSGGSGTCYLFEGDMDTSCSGAYPGRRDLTDSEKRALLRRLNAVPQSIRFAAGK
jgi:hypothetical protein